MIIADAFRKIFDGLAVDIVSNGQPLSTTLKFGYGDQTELLKWLANEQNRTNPDKYPLSWYILSQFTEHLGWYETDASLFIMTTTVPEWFNTKRQTESYVNIIEPVWQLIKSKLETTQHVSVFASDYEKRFWIFDFPDFGLTESPQSKLDVNSNNKSLSSDIVDARLVKFKLRIKANCIN